MPVRKKLDDSDKQTLVVFNDRHDQYYYIVQDNDGYQELMFKLFHLYSSHFPSEDDLEKECERAQSYVNAYNIMYNSLNTEKGEGVEDGRKMMLTCLEVWENNIPRNHEKIKLLNRLRSSKTPTQEHVDFMLKQYDIRCYSYETVEQVT